MDFKGYIIMDNHMHLSKDGRMLDAVRMFVSAGGNAINLVNLPDHGRPRTGYYSGLYSDTLKIASLVRESYKIPVVVTLGPYPVDYFYFTEAGLNGFDEMERGLRIAESLCSNGSASAIGEIGRPHFSYDEKLKEKFDQIIYESFEFCRDLNIPAILHTEDLGKEGYMEMVRMASESGIKLKKVVKHHALPDDLSFCSGLTHSILASRRNVREIRNFNENIVLETDYVDDPTSWKVIPPDSVPRRAAYLRETHENWKELFQNIFMDSPIELFGEETFARLEF